MFGNQYNYFDKKRGWKRIHAFQAEYGDIIHMFEETIDHAKNLGLFPENTDGIAYYLTNGTSSIASCWYHRWTDNTYDFAFCFNEEVLQKIPLSKLRETVIHEVGHACAVGDHHGNKWQRYCQAIGKRWGITWFSRLETDAAINAVLKEKKIKEAKFLIRCPACGATWRRLRASSVVRHAGRCTCPCGWKGLEVTEL